jgi:hypothetical protein
MDPAGSETRHAELNESSSRGVRGYRRPAVSRETKHVRRGGPPCPRPRTPVAGLSRIAEMTKALVDRCHGERPAAESHLERSTS